MSKSFTGDYALAEMTEGQRAPSALDINSQETSTGGSERSELLKLANSLVAERPAKTTRAIEPDRNSTPVLAKKLKRKKTSRSRIKSKAKAELPASVVRQRFGLPDGFVPRLQRYGRSVLLEENFYRLPNGAEYLPAHPLGTLGSHQHLYALLSVEQYLARQRGSVYVRNDGRIFDYSVDSGTPGGDIFDTGYTIFDLERTGRYAPTLEQKKKKPAPAEYRGVASGR